MNSRDTAKSALKSIEDGRLDDFARCLADDAVCVGLAPHVMKKAECAKVIHTLLAGMPDLEFNATRWEGDLDRIGVQTEMTATHTGVLPPVLPSVPPVLATGRHIRMPQGRIDFYFHDHKIVRIVFEDVEGGGLLGVLRQLGIEVPYAA